jgi:arginine/lysine/histidine transporter system substrate-binding protein
MKKFLSLLLALAMVLALASCGSTASNSTDTSAAASGSDASASASDADASGETAELTTLTEGVLTMATNAQFPPYEMVADGDGVDGTGYEGIDVELAAALAEKLGLKLQIDDMDFDAALTAVQQGKCDVVLGGLTYTEARDELMDFSTPYSQGVQVIIVKEDSTVTSADDLADLDMIGTQRATTGFIYCSDDYGDDHVAAYDNGAAAVQALLNGQVDAVVIDQAPAQEFVAANDGLKIVETPYITEDYCVAMAEGNTAMQDAINSALAELTEDGTVQSILDKYITAD